MSVKSHHDLDVWKLSIELVDDIYNFTITFAKEETYGLAAQMRRCPVSIPSNIAEGSARKNTKELLQFLSIARGSLAELETQLIIAERRNYGTKEQIKKLFQQLSSIAKMLTNLRYSLERKAA